jgi:hypothetical protein
MTNPGSSPMVRLVVDLPAAVPLAALSEFARAHGCTLYRTPQGVYRLRPDRQTTDRGRASP